jgi:hypothetical protein
MTPWLQTEAGLRGDYVAGYGWATLPRISTLFHLAPNLSSRLGAGVGYKAPTIFTEDAERIQLQNASADRYHLVNVPGYIDSKGWETNLKFTYGQFPLVHLLHLHGRPSEKNRRHHGNPEAVLDIISANAHLSFPAFLS